MGGACLAPQVRADGSHAPRDDGARQRGQTLPPTVERSPLRGVVFDMGDVLYDATVWRRWLLQLLARLGLHTQYRTFYALWDRDFLDQVHRGERDYGEAFRAFLATVGLSRGQIEEIEAASQARRRELEGAVRPFPGVRAGLERLDKLGLKLAVLSDSERTASQLRDFLDRLGLRNCFAAVVSSRDLGMTKPHPTTYDAAARELEIACAELAFVGHDAEELAGATRCRLRTIAFNYDPECAAHAFVEQFVDLARVVQPWTAPTAGAR